MSLLKGLFGFYLFSLLFSEKLKDDPKKPSKSFMVMQESEDNYKEELLKEVAGNI